MPGDKGMYGELFLEESAGLIRGAWCLNLRGGDVGVQCRRASAAEARAAMGDRVLRPQVGEGVEGIDGGLCRSGGLGMQLMLGFWFAVLARGCALRG